MSDIKDNYDQDTFEGFWEQKANETTATLQRLLDNTAATFLNLALKEIETQLLSGAEVINNPLKVGILSQLGFDISSGKIPAFFTEIFGDNDTLSSLDVAISFGLTEDQFNSIPAQAERLEASEGPILTEAPSLGAPPVFTADSQRIVDPIGSVGTAEDSFLNEDFISEAFENRRYSDATPEEIQAIVDSVEEKWGDSWDRLSDQSKELEITGRINDYVRDNTVNIKDLYRIFQAELGRRPTTEEVNELIGGTRSSVQGSEDFVTDYINTTVAPRPEGTVDLKELNEDQLSTFWPEIKESLEGLSETVKNVLFGTGGPPSTLGELLDSIGEGIMEGLKGPIAVTFDPNKGVTLDLKIPVGFEINGTSIQIPIFDEEGNLVTGEELKKVFVDAAGRLWDSTGGVLKEIGEIFTDGSGNIVVDIIDAGQAVLEGIGLSEDGALVGTLVEAAIGDFQYDPGTGEIIEEVQASVDDLGLDEGEEDGLADTVDGDGDVPPSVDPDDSQDGLGLTEEDDTEELILTEAPSLEAPPVFTEDSQRIIDPIGSVGSTTEVYSDDEDDTRQEESIEIPLDTVEETELFEQEEVIEEDDTREEESVEIPLDTVEETELTEEVVIKEDDTRQEESVEIPLDTVVETELTEDTVVITDGDDNGDTDGQPPLTSEPIINDDVQEEPPLVGPVGPVGATGAAGAAGAPGSRGGYMGGLSYQLPQFVAVQYQPKDYTVELNRIINESLFKGMI